MEMESPDGEDTLQQMVKGTNTQKLETIPETVQSVHSKDWVTATLCSTEVLGTCIGAAAETGGDIGVGIALEAVIDALLVVLSIL